jgi:hypothetical protein
MVVLLIGTLVWGQCASCPLVAKAQESHGCCQKQESTGDCHGPKDDTSKCAAHSMAPADYNKSTADQAAPVAVAAVLAEPLPAVSRPMSRTAAVPIYSPPDLNLLHSVLLV